MLLRPLIGLLLLLIATSPATAQNDVSPDTLVPGTPTFEELQLKVNGEERIRVTTPWGEVELYAPELSAGGLSFGRAQFEKRPPRGTRGFGRPLAFSQVSKIEVRVGNAWAGALIGAGFGILLTTGVYGICGEQCDTGSGAKVGTYLATTTVTTLIGSAIGTGGWGWRSVWSADRPAFSLIDVGGDRVGIGFRLGVDWGS